MARGQDPREATARVPTAAAAARIYSKGKLLQEYVEEAVSLGPLGSHHVVVRESERHGGVGASFVLVWRSSSRVVPPLVQAVMITTASLQGITFLSDSVVIEELDPLPDE